MEVILKKCPLCSGEPLMEQLDLIVVIRCKDCGLMLRHSKSIDKDAFKTIIDVWNRRSIN